METFREMPLLLQERRRASAPNPFLIPMITDQILTYSNYATRKTCRLVCADWERQASRFLNIKKSPYTLRIPSENDLRRCNEDIINENDTNEQICRYYDFICIPPNCNYLIVPYNIGLNFYPIVYQILLNFGQQIRFLELRNAHWTLAQLRDVLYKLAPKLEELVLAEDFVLPKVDPSSSRVLVEFDPKTHSIRQLLRLKSIKLELQDENLQNLANLQFLQELFTVAPNVECIRGSTKAFTENAPPHTTIFSSLLFRSIAESQALITSKALKYLDINVELRNADIDLLQAANFPLHTFHLTLDMLASSVKVDGLLNSLKGSLRRLKITHRGCIRTSPNLVNLQNLEYFALHGYETELRGDPRRGDSIVLDQALYFVFRFVPLCLFPAFIEGCEALTKIVELRLGQTFFARKDIYNLKSLFPCLKKLRASFLDDDTLGRICQDYPNLEELGAMDGKFSDMSITGISPQIQEIFQNGVTNEVKDHSLRELASITDLKYLRVLELGSKNVSDFGIVNGIAICTNLKELQIDCPNISDVSLQKIVQKLDLDRLNVKSGSFTECVVQQTRRRLSRKSFSM
ncbi:unnamed protein product [Orchesella dallaii]|uniref:Uncharacterized protein n=1 Tax=Orchesella dallaii TaxID=48710 RepID=A0ABP1RWH6_9HEXA